MRLFSVILVTVAVLSVHSLKAQDKETPMNTLMERARLTCKLTTPELQQRKKTVIADLKKLLVEKIETENGIKYKFDGTDNILDKLNEFIKTERLCCDFFVFTLTASSDTKATWLELSGPEGTKDFIKYELDF